MLGNGGDYGVILLDGAQRAIGAEKRLKAAGFIIKLIPVPRQIGSDCGVCLRFLWKDREAVEAELAEARIDVGGVHHLTAG